MASKEHKGGILKNDQVEEDLRVKGKTSDGKQTYTGSQDRGDKEVRHLGNEVKKADGRLDAEESGE